MFAYTYRAYWREVGATEWNEVQSPTPITWNTENIPASEPTGVLGGQCIGQLYRVIGTWEESTSSGGQPPVNWQKGTWQASNTSIAPRGPIRGVFVNFSASVPIWRLGCNVGSTATDISIFRTGSGGDTFFWNGTLRGAVTRWARNVVITSITTNPPGGNDNCGNSPDYSPGTEASCKTTFSTGLIITRPQCIEVTLNPPECECCRELLPKANSILSRLG